jgi:hypothetical protein
MNRGVLLYCFDTPATRYHEIANRCVKLINKYLRLPVTIFTDEGTLGKWKNRPNCDLHTIDIDRKNTKLNKPWYNVERHMAYDHSPYDHTIVIDVDYFCFSDKLLRLLDTDYDFLIHKDAHDVTFQNDMKYNRESMIDLVWATVLIFKKTPRVKAIFDTVKIIKNNYSHFCNLYRISYRNFRNDYAFAIALNQINGFLDYDVITDSIATVPEGVDILDINDQGITLSHNNRSFSIQHQDVHMINKGMANV